MSGTARVDALQQIVILAKAHEIDAKEIAAAIGKSTLQSNRATLFLASIGGVLILTGITAFTTMFWGEMTSLCRVVITLCAGFATYGMGLAAASSQRYRKAALPLLQIGIGLQPTGLYVLDHEYLHLGHDVRYADVFVFGMMLVQQGFCFVALRRTLLLFYAIVFAGGLAATGLSLAGIHADWSSTLLGLLLICIARLLDRSRYGNIAGLWFFIGGVSFLGGLFDIMSGSPVELAYLLVACGVIYLSIVVRSTVLMLVGVLAMLGFIADFTERHFVHSIGWPMSLVVMGMVLLGIGAGAIRIRNRYMQT